MTRLGHLFDFNQALSGRKPSANKGHRGGGLEATRRSLDVEDSVLEASKRNVAKIEQILFGYGTPKAHGNKTSGELTTKSLILQDLPKESSRGRSQSPSVVGRLMGLDALPSDARKIPASNMEEKSLHNAEPSLPHLALDAKKNRAPNSCSYQVALPHGEDAGNHKRGAFPFQSHPQEKHLQEFKEEFQAWQSWKAAVEPRPSRLADSIGSQAAVAHLHACEKQADIKYNLLRERISSLSKPLNRRESKDIRDAMDILQSNKDFVMKILQESDPSLARHLKGSEAGLPSGQMWQSYKIPDGSKELRPHPEREDFINTRKSFTTKQHNWRGSDLNPIVGTKSFTGPSYDHHKHLGHLFLSHSKNGQQTFVEAQVPTRIVVLKPGKVRGPKNMPTFHSCSSKDLLGTKDVSDHQIEILEKLRAKLTNESSEKVKYEKRNYPLNPNGQYLSRDPRKLAREIARQVRENVTRELMDNTRERKSRKRSNLIRQIIESVEDDDAFQIRKAYLDGYDLSAHQDPDINDASNKEKQRKGNGMLHMLGSENLDDGLILQLQHTTAFKKGEYSEVSWQSSGGLKPSHGCTVAGGFSSDEFYIGQDDLQSASGPLDFDIIASSRMGNGKSPACDVRDVHHDKEESDTEGLSDVGSEKVVDVSTVSVGMKGQTVEKVGREDALSIKDESNFRDPCAGASQKEQCQIEDTGPVLDNESSIASVEDNIDTEEELIEEYSVIFNSGLQGEPMMEQISRALEPDNDILSEIGGIEELSSLQLLNDEVPFYSIEKSMASMNSYLPTKQPENPSPISVLSSHFQDESEVPSKFKELSSDLQELQIQLRLLQFDEDDTESILEGPCIAYENSSYDSANSSECRFNVNDSKYIDYKLACPGGDEPEMFYVKALLSAWGTFTQRSEISIRPLDPFLFQEMEAQLFGNVPDGDLKHVSVLNSSSRHLLFDIVNDVLLEVLRPPVNFLFWIGPFTAARMQMPFSKDLIFIVWSHVSQLLRKQSEGQVTLQKLVSKDLAKRGQWLNLNDAEAVGFGVARSILNDLLEETLLIL